MHGLLLRNACQLQRVRAHQLVAVGPAALVVRIGLHLRNALMRVRHGAADIVRLLFHSVAAVAGMLCSLGLARMLASDSDGRAAACHASGSPASGSPASRAG